MASKLSKKECQLIYELDKNARNNITRIAKSLRLSQQSLSYLLNKLKGTKVIKSYSTIFDPSRFGLINYILFIRLNNHKKQVLKQIISYLNSSNTLVQLYSTIGKWDLVAMFSTQNPSNFNKSLKKLMVDIGNYVLSYDILSVVVMHKYGLNSINKSTKDEYDIILGGDREILNFSNDDIILMKYLFKEPNIKLIKLAKLVNRNIKTVIRKIKSLQESKVIRGFTVITDFNRIDFQHYFLLLRMRGMDKNTEKKFNEYCKKNKSINFLTKCFGYWDVIISFVNETNKDFKFCIDEIKESFGDLIQDIEVLQVGNTEKFIFLPEFVFDKEK